MKQKLLVTILLAVLFLVQCEKKETDESLLSPVEEQKIVAIGDTLSRRLINTLVLELTKAIQEGGPEHAISVCNTTALQLTSKVAQESGKQVNIKRTTRRYRNPANAPDRWEEAALAFFEKKIQQGESPAYMIQKIDKDGEIIYRYYKPLKVGTLCLSCHGNPDDISPAVLEELKKRYPEDHATGYQEGDFRGVIRVEMRGLLTR